MRLRRDLLIFLARLLETIHFLIGGFDGLFQFGNIGEVRKAVGNANGQRVRETFDFDFTEQVAYVLRPTDVNGDGAPEWYWPATPYFDVNALMTPIPGCTRATHINNGGDILAQCSTFVRWRDTDRDGMMNNDELVDFGLNAPVAMNNRGAVVGRMPNGHAFLWSDATGFRDLGADVIKIEPPGRGDVPWPRTRR